MPIDLNDEHTIDFEGRRAEVRADYEQRLVTSKEYQATVARIDEDEDEYHRRREAGEVPDDATPADTARPTSG